MKLYKTKMVTLKVRSCSECPNQVVRLYSVEGTHGSALTCGAINYNGVDANGNEIIVSPTTIRALHHGGFLPDCPLDDVLGEVGK